MNQIEQDNLMNGVEELLPLDEWKKKVATGRPLTIKLGLDPTAPDIHLGHTVVLNKMNQLQDMGHNVIFLIGDFTTLIGDPTGRNDTRPTLTTSEIKKNADTYCEQAFKILDPNKTTVRFNSEWCEKLGTAGLIQLASQYSVARMMERNDFAQRFSNGNSIALHEFLYPLLQGYDSVALKADLEIGGTDQKFNLMMGRHLQEKAGQEPQCIITMPLLVGLDGVNKMSKSKNNYIGVTETPNNMFSSVMSISDELMWDWYKLLSFQPKHQVEKLQKSVSNGLNPKSVKVALAKEIVSRFHSSLLADEAENDFNLRAKGGIPDDVPEFVFNEWPVSIGSLLKQSGLAPSIGEANRLIDGKGVKINGNLVSDKGLKLDCGDYILQVGRRRFVKIVSAPTFKKRISP